MSSGAHPSPRRPGLRNVVDAVSAVCGLAVVAVLLLHIASATATLGQFDPMLALAAGAIAGAVAGRVGHQVCGSPWPGAIAVALLVPVIPWSLSRLLLTTVPVLTSVAFGTGVLTIALLTLSAHPRRMLGAAGACALVLAGGATVPAGAWSVDEPAHDDPAMVRGNGIVVAVDTHAFVLRQGVEILRADGRTDVAGFLLSPDPQAPFRRDQQTGDPTGQREDYLWRMQRGSRDADRNNKPSMPDHFFNWWTHSGKGLIAGPSAADYAEEQHAEAVKLWKRGDRSAAMYHLGAAAHLVQDGCTPPHASAFIPEHRAFEDWVVSQQPQMAATSGGIYQEQFRLKTGHGGPEWSSSHTRGWVDECAHRAAQLIPNVVRPTSTLAGPLDSDDATAAHLRETQQLTAGYLAFFFDEVGGP